MRARLETVDWLDEPTRQAALAKLDALVPNVANDPLDGTQAIVINQAASPFATAPAIVGLIGQRLAGGQRLHGETSLGESASALAAGTVQAVGNVVTAPLRIGERSGEPDTSAGALLD